eukprot:scaffold417654_cov18-Prasinocladus_malaysianus.AAC.1
MFFFPAVLRAQSCRHASSHQPDAGHISALHDLRRMLIHHPRGSALPVAKACEPAGTPPPSPNHGEGGGNLSVHWLPIMHPPFPRSICWL